MSLSIANNIAALRSQRYLDKSTNAVASVFERLSSGARINRAVDDAAGLAVASSLNTNSRLYNQASRNINDSISALTIADAAISELSNIVTRITELAEQSANGIYSGAQRNVIDQEAQSLRKEFNRIIATTSFNGSKLLDGSSNGILVQAGINSESSARINSGTGQAITRVVGDGTFEAEILHSTGTDRAQELSFADYNSDGKLDMIISGTSGNGLRISLGNGNGTFLAQTNVDTSTTSAHLSYDINQDGRSDIISYDANSNNIEFRAGLGNGTFAASTAVGSIATDLYSFNLADVTGDGIVDLMAFATSSSNLLIYSGNGNGTFNAVQQITASTNIASYAAADIDNDGDQDLAIRGTTGTYIYTNSGSGTFTNTTNLPGYTGGGGSISFGDVNADGNLDMLENGNGDSDHNLFLGNGNGTFKAATEVLNIAGVTGGGYLVDLNEDGYSDILAQAVSGSANLYTALASESGTFGSYNTLTSSVGSSYGIYYADINGDGAIDVAHANGANNNISIFIANEQNTSTLDPFNLKNRISSLSALDLMRARLDELSSNRALIGAAQSRLESALSNVRVASENSQSAASRIMDSDIAQESANLTRLQIMQQAGQAVLAQANSQPRLALQLLQV